MAKQSTSKVQCTICSVDTLISHYIKYFKNKRGEVQLGGSDMEGPLCTNCYNDIQDQALGKPKMLEKEHNYVKTHIQKKT
tara:strand:- start:209 stop:448 length:240 start_codon:yes stop_codon:yes gene_type:complete